MAIQDYYEFPTAYNPETERLQANADFQVYAATDTSFTTQLQVFAADSGVALTPLRSNSIGMIESFRVQGDPTQILIKSGSFTTLLTSKFGAVVEAGLDAATVQRAIAVGPLATAAKDEAVVAKNLAVKAAQDAAAVGATNDSINAGLLRDEQSETFAGTRDIVLDFGGSGRFEVVPDPANPGFGLIVPVGSTPPPAQDVAPVIITTSLGTLTAGVPVSEQIVSTGEPDTFFVSQGTPPSGLSLTSAGSVVGTPTAAGSYDFSVTATNAVDADTQQFTGSVVAANSAPVITGPQSITLTQGVPASAQLTASGSQPITYAVTGGNPPAGLALSTAGALSGTPTGTGSYTVTVTATNAYGSGSKTYTGSVVAASSGGAVTPPSEGSTAPVGGNRVASFGPNGTHYPTRTPRVEDTAGWDYDVEVECTWAAISQAITTAHSRFPNGKCRIQVKPGTLPGNGAGSTVTPVLQNVGGANRQTRILVVPRDGVFSIKHSASARIHNVTGVTFLGFCPWGEGVAEANSYGIVLTNCKDTAWGWSKTRFMNITTAAGDTRGVEYVECVAPLVGLRDDDRMAFRNTSGGNVYGVLLDGCYVAGTYKVAGSSSHCDAFQISGDPGVFKDIVLRDTIIFASTNAAFITTSLTSGSLENCVLMGGDRVKLRYPLPADRNQFTSGPPVGFNGAPSPFTVKDSILTGKVVPKFTSVVNSKLSGTGAPTPVSGSFTIDTTVLDTIAKIDAASPFPTDARLRTYWAAV